MQRSWAIRHHERMNAYSEDLRKKIVEAVERGMLKIEAARTFGVGISSVKRYVWRPTARGGRWLRRSVPAPSPSWTRARGSCWKQTSKSALRPRCHRGASSCGKLAGWRLATPRFPGSSSASDGPEKKISGSDRTRRVAESGLAGDGRRRSWNRRQTAGIRGRDGHQHLAFPLYAWSRRGKLVFASVVPRNWGRTLPCWRA